MENSQPLFNLKNIQVGHYVTLAGGLGFTVSEVTFSEHADEKDKVALVLTRYDKTKTEFTKKTTVVTHNGYFTREGEPSAYDIVRVSNPDRIAFKTKAGVHPDDVNLVDKLKQYGGDAKVRTRNHYWFIVKVCAWDQNTKVITLKMENLTGNDQSTRLNNYLDNGLFLNIGETPENRFNPFDIVEVLSL